MANAVRRTDRELARHDDDEPSTEASTEVQIWPGGQGHHAVTELLSPNTGALSPFGDDIRFPLPVAALAYEHPTARPNR